jgi:hypothetical protein
VNLSAEWWSVVGQLIEHRQIIIPNDEKLIAQLTSRRKFYDSNGREKLESKKDTRAVAAMNRVRPPNNDCDAQPIESRTIECAFPDFPGVNRLAGSVR